MPAMIFDLVDNLRIAPQKRDAIERGAAYGVNLKFRAADTDGSSAGDWRVKMDIRRAYADRDRGTPLLSLDSAEGEIAVGIETDAVNGDKVTIGASATAAQTAILPVGKWYYDIKLIRVADNYARRIMEGRVQVKGDVTQ